MIKKKLRVASIKFGGLATGGTEKWLQTICANLPKDRFEVDFFYCDSAPYIGSDWIHPDTDQSRFDYMISKKVNLVKFSVGAKNITVPSHDWVGSNFWDLFKEDKYDLVLGARAGHKEYPFYLIEKTPIIEFVTLPGMSDNQKNICKSIHISKFQLDTWLRVGGDISKAEVIPLFAELPSIDTPGNLREELGIPENAFVFGMHQRPDDGIFSPVPLDAYSRVEKQDSVSVSFILLGGSSKYVDQAKSLGLKNFHRLEPTGDYIRIAKFLSTLNVYTHGRADGETFSLSIAEGMSFGLPIISHAAPAMGHVETIGNGGIIANTLEEYVSEMQKHMTTKDYHSILARNARNHFTSNLCLEVNMHKIVNILETVYAEQVARHKLEDLSADEFWGTVWT